MSEEKNPYIYDRRFKDYSLKEKSKIFADSIKGQILRTLFKSPIGKRLNPSDYFAAKKAERETFGHDTNERFKYDKIEISRVKFFEALEIDDFDNYKSILISKSPDTSHLLFGRSKESIKEALDKIKNSLDTISYGGELFHLRFNNQKYSDLLQGASISYIKTFESYFILCIEVKPSDKFNQIFSSIVSSNEYQIETTIYNNSLKILRTGKFVKHSAVTLSNLAYSLDNLFSDLDYQVRYNITNTLKGQFYKKESLPRIEMFEVESIEDFQRDAILRHVIGNVRDSFSLDDTKIQIITRPYSNGDNYRIRVVKEKGHGKRKESASDLTDYDKIETHDILLSLSLPCTLDAILRNHSEELNQLKRRVYDYINESAKRNFWNKILFLKYSQNYVNLKVSLAKNILTFKRFEEEFSNRNLRIFSRDLDLRSFKRAQSNNRESDENSDLKTYFESLFKSQIERLNKKIATLEQVFKPIEDLSIYRVNFWLQISSLFIGVLALILGLDKLTALFIKFYKWLISF